MGGKGDVERVICCEGCFLLLVALEALLCLPCPCPCVGEVVEEESLWMVGESSEPWEPREGGGETVVASSSKRSRAFRGAGESLLLGEVKL